MNQPCEHLKNLDEGDFAPFPVPPVCEECLKEGLQWVSLRECMSCGQVGCCDSSPGKHATKHFHITKHPVIRSAMPGEGWTWCYVHEASGELAPKRRTNKKGSQSYG